MIYFHSRNEARKFSRESELYKLVDNGPEADPKRRWGVQVLYRKKLAA